MRSKAELSSTGLLKLPTPSTPGSVPAFHGSIPVAMDSWLRPGRLELLAPSRCLGLPGSILCSDTSDSRLHPGRLGLLAPSRPSRPSTVPSRPPQTPGSVLTTSDSPAPSSALTPRTPGSVLAASDSPAPSSVLTPRTPGSVPAALDSQLHSDTSDFSAPSSVPAASDSRPSRPSMAPSQPPQPSPAPSRPPSPPDVPIRHREPNPARTSSPRLAIAPASQYSASQRPASSACCHRLSDSLARMPIWSASGKAIKA